MRSLDMTCDSGMPKACGVVSVRGERAAQGDLKFTYTALSQQQGSEFLFEFELCSAESKDLQCIHLFYSNLNLNSKLQNNSFLQRTLNIQSESAHTYASAFLNKRGKEERGAWACQRIGCNE